MPTPTLSLALIRASRGIFVGYDKHKNAYHILLSGTRQCSLALVAKFQVGNIRTPTTNHELHLKQCNGKRHVKRSFTLGFVYSLKPSSDFTCTFHKQSHLYQHCCLATINISVFFLNFDIVDHQVLKCIFSIYINVLVYVF